LKQVQEKVYDIPTEKLITAIKVLNEPMNSTQSTARAFEPDTDLAPDSSVWVLEAALNYHFDKVPNDHDVYADSVEFSAPLDLLTGVPTISPANFNDVYNKFKNEIVNKSAGPQKVKVIDITATIDYAANIINYKAEIIFYIGSGVSNCQPFTTQTAKWSSMFWAASCGAGPVLDGPTLMNQKLNNCPAYNPGCNNWFWTSVSSAGFNGQTFPTQLFSASTPVPMFPCNILSGSQLNNKVTGSISLAVGSAPAGKLISNYNVTPAFIGTATFNNGWWQMTVQYAVPRCYNNPN